MDPLFDEVREAASRRAWSRGVELVRAGAVTLARDDTGPQVLHVAEPGAPLPRSVTLERAGGWDCDCDGEEDPCAHVAAAVIARRRAAESGVALSATERSGARLRHRLLRVPGGLALERRAVESNGRETPFAVRLRALAAGRVAGPRVRAEPADLAVDDALDDPRGGPLSRGALARLLPLLARCADVRLDDAPVRIDPEPLLPLARVEDHPEGFRVSVELVPGGGERLSEDLVRQGEVLRPLRETRLTGRELAELPRGRIVPFEQGAELAGEWLPELAKRVPVDVRSTRLPRAAARREPPRIRVEVRRSGEELAVRADLVYGDPPRARVEDGRLVPLGGPIPRRDEPAERALARRVQSELALPLGSELLLRDEEALAAAARLRAFAGEVRGDAHRSFARAAGLVPRVDAGGEQVALWFEAPGDAHGGGDPAARRVDATRVLRAFEAGHGFVALDGGALAPLPADWLAHHGRDVAAILESRDAAGRVTRAALPDLARLCDALGAPRPPGLERLRALVDGFEALPRAALPPDLRAELRGYQRLGVDWLAFLRDAGLGALLADDMGLGKTLQVLSAVCGRTLVVCPTSVLQGWADEARRFRPALSVCLYHGPGRQLDADADLTLTSYALLRLDADALGAAAWDALVLDEAQAIKNPDSQAARAARGLRAGWRVALTGTPVENRLEELWSLMQFANPGLLGALPAFQARWARPIAAGEPGVAEALRRRIRPFLLRRRKREVAPELPPRSERVLRCELDAAERAASDAVRAAARRDVVERLDSGASPLAALEALLRLRQAACHRDLVPGQHAERSSKVELLVEELETVVAEGHRALVFSQWTSLLDRVEPALRRAAIGWVRLDGSTRDRAGVVARFQDDAGPPVMLISLQAGGTGLNLTAADHVFLLDPWWNPAVEDQAADRAHRIGQTRPVEIHRLVAADTVEERVLALARRKRGLADAALADAAGAAPLTRDDLLALLD